MAIQLPKEAISINDRLAAFTNVYNGRQYMNICKSYKDDEGQLCRGKGLTISFSDFCDIVDNIPKLQELVKKAMDTPHEVENDAGGY